MAKPHGLGGRALSVRRRSRGVTSLWFPWGLKGQQKQLRAWLEHLPERLHSRQVCGIKPDTHPGLRGTQGSSRRRGEIKSASATGDAARDEMQQMTRDTSYGLQKWKKHHQMDATTGRMKNFTQWQGRQGSQISSASKMHKPTSAGMQRRLSERLSFLGPRQTKRDYFKF